MQNTYVEERFRRLTNIPDEWFDDDRIAYRPEFLKIVRDITYGLISKGLPVPEIGACQSGQIEILWEEKDILCSFFDDSTFLSYIIRDAEVAIPSEDIKTKIVADDIQKHYHK